MVEAARFELASLTFEVRSHYMLSRFSDVPVNFESTRFQPVSPMSLSPNSPRTREFDQPTVDARPHPAGLGERTASCF